jgi:branched-chain amino acid transport system ATP-binding protein
MSALCVENACLRFGGIAAVADVNIELSVGERRVLLGPNGAGKTTLFNIIGGQLRPQQGRTLMFGRDVTHLAPYQRARAGLSRTFQITTLFANLSVEENIYLAVQACSPVRYAILRDGERVGTTVTRVNELLAQWHFAGERSTLVRDLSYGEQRKLELAMALTGNPRLLLLDEPAAGLSGTETENFVGLIQGLSREVTVLVIEHDMDVAFEIGERFTVMDRGRVVVEGSKQEIRGDPQIQAIYFGDSEP